jgi:hypothetical protein
VMSHPTDTLLSETTVGRDASCWLAHRVL